MAHFHDGTSFVVYGKLRLIMGSGGIGFFYAFLDAIRRDELRSSVGWRMVITLNLHFI